MTETEQQPDWAERAFGIGTTLLKNALPPGLTREVLSQQFELGEAGVVFVKANGCRVKVRRHTARHVQLDARLYVSAGLDIATEQDEAGVYIVILRKRMVGSLSRSEVRLALPHGCDLIADLEHGDLLLEEVCGRVTIPG